MKKSIKKIMRKAKKMMVKPTDLKRSTKAGVRTEKPDNSTNQK